MKTIKKIGIMLMASLSLTGTVLLSAPSAVSATSGSIDTTVIDEKWGKATFVYGGGLNETQIEETAKLLGIENIENVASVAVTGEDLVTYLKSGSSDTSSMISSVLVQKTDEGKGVDVTIETPENITQITEEQYANAAITAGVANAKIIVGSVSKVTGESALTGIYKAFDVNGETLDQDRMAVAQDELETTNEIAQANSDNPDFETAKLDQAIIEIKQALAELKEQQGELATKEDIERIINEAIANNDLNNIVTQDQIDKLIALFEKYQETSAINSDEVKQQLSDLSTTVRDKFGDIVKQAEDEGVFDKIGNFFKQIWDAVVGLFQ